MGMFSLHTSDINIYIKLCAHTNEQ